MKNPLVTIITVCYNSEKTIAQTIESVMKQSYKNIEYIIIDGKSTDGTLQVIQKYKKIMMEKLKVVSEKDNGIYEAMNKGIALAKGKLIGIINSNDWYENDAVENIICNYDDSIKYQIIYGMERDYKEDKEMITILKHYQFLETNMIAHSSCFVSISVYDDLGKFNLKYKVSADYEFMLRMYLSKKVKFRMIYKLISNFRLGGISSTQFGVIDTAKLRYNFNLISKRKLYLIIIKNKIHMIIKRNNNKRGAVCQKL